MIILEEPIALAPALDRLHLVHRVLLIKHRHSRQFFILLLLLFLLLVHGPLHDLHSDAVQGLQIGKPRHDFILKNLVFLLALKEGVERVLQEGDVADVSEPVVAFFQEGGEVAEVIFVGREGFQRFEDGKALQGMEAIIINNQRDKVNKRIEIRSLAELIERHIQMLDLARVFFVLLLDGLEILLHQRQHQKLAIKNDNSHPLNK